MTDTTGTGSAQLRRLIGVYDADGTWRGELAYWIGARLGRRHCSLCDITHGSVRARPEWVACKAGLPVEFVTFHRNDQPDEVRAAAGGRAPAVVATPTAGSCSSSALPSSTRVAVPSSGWWQRSRRR